MIVAVLGAGGHGHDIRAIAEAAGHGCYFLDDRWKPSHRTTALADDAPFVVGVNDPATKRRLAVGSNPVTLVHPTATVDRTAVIRPGCVIGAGTHIGPGCFLGDHVHVGAGVTMTRTSVEAFTTISPGVDIAGDVTVGAGVLIGVGARVANLRIVGPGAVVGAGAVVVRDVQADETVVSRFLTATRSQRMRVTFDVIGASADEVERNAHEQLDRFAPDSAGRWTVTVDAEPLTMDYRLWVGHCEATR